MRGMLIRARQLNGIAGQPFSCELLDDPERSAAAVADIAWEVVGALPA